MKSPNPNSGFYKAETARTLDGNGGNPTCNQGGIAIVEGNGSRPSHHGNGYAESDVMYTLNTVDRHAVNLFNFFIKELHQFHLVSMDLFHSRFINKIDRC